MEAEAGYIKSRIVAITIVTYLPVRSFFMKANEIEKYFDDHTGEYDRWFSEHVDEFNDQLNFIRAIIPPGKGIEIGTGTGMFASRLGIGYGIDISEKMAAAAQKRGVNVKIASAYSIPYADRSFDFAFFMVTLCFLDRPVTALREARRVAKSVISVILDKNTDYIRRLENEKRGFYAYAHFLSEDDIIEFYREAGMCDLKVYRSDLVYEKREKYKLVAVQGK